MTTTVKRLLFWTPRLLTILFTLFLAIFALDVFGEGYGFWKTILGLLMHLIPNFVMIVILIIAWKCEWVGAVLFFGLGVFYVFWAWGRFPLSVYFTISGPLFLIGILFLINWLKRK